MDIIVNVYNGKNYSYTNVISFNSEEEIEKRYIINSLLHSICFYPDFVIEEDKTCRGY